MTLYSLTFVTAFLPCSAVAYHLSPKRMKPILLSAASVMFYLMAAGRYFYLLPVLSLLVYFFSLGKNTRACAYACIVLLAILRIAGINEVGISFFLLRAAAYIKEGYREKNAAKVFAFLMLFPTTCAGPITSYGDIRTSFDRDIDYSLVCRGILWFLKGAVKKLLFADTLSMAFDTFVCGTTFLSAAMALVSYSLYIYFDFSGYSDVAIGVCNILGIRLPKNFDFPYAAKSVSEFFRRWHISLGRFLFNFVYLPLGGSRYGRWRTVLSLFAVWLFSALWHGGNITFLIWGAWFFLLVTAEKMGVRFGRAATLVSVMLGWVPFFSNSLGEMISFFRRLFALGDTLVFSKADIYNCIGFLPTLLLSAFLATPILHRLLAKVYSFAPIALYILAFPAFVLVLSCIASGGHRPFIYAAF